MEEQVLNFFKLFTDPTRLRMAALLLEQHCTLEEMAARLKINLSDAARHLAQFEKTDLLRREVAPETTPPPTPTPQLRRPKPASVRYFIDPQALETLKREVLSGRHPVPVESADENADDFDRKVVRNYAMPDGRLRELPSQEKKLMPILRHVAQAFEPGQRYTEKQVNETLKRFYSDFASLRRYLIDFKVIQRAPDGSSYWREDPAAHD